MQSSKDLWTSLRRVSWVRFVARSDSGTPGWSGSAVGAVVVESPAPDVLIFLESGTFQPLAGKETRFSNIFRWSILAGERIRLEHLRQGVDQPVLLFDLGPGPDGTWVPVSPHLCREDCYSAELRIQDAGVDMTWAITGPKKCESIAYEYRWHGVTFPTDRKEEFDG
jgi:hypothetical protein